MSGRRMEMVLSRLEILLGRRTLAVLLAACLCQAQAQADEFRAEDLYDPTVASGAMDLAETPWWVELMKAAGVKTVDDLMREQFAKQFGKITSALTDGLKGKQYGELLKVQVYADEFGTPVVPGGELVVPVGIGMEPIDALAEQYRVPQLKNQPPSGLSNQSYYVWIKESGGKLKAGMIPRAFRQSLESKAFSEARRRDLLANWERSLPDGGIDVFGRSAYWSDVATNYSKYLTDAAEKRSFEDLQKQFEKAEAKFNESYGAYQNTLREIARVARYNQTLEGIQTTIGLISSGIQLGSVVSSKPNEQGDTKVRTDAKAAPSVASSIEYTKTRADYLKGTVDTWRLRVNGDAESIRKLNQLLNGVFEKNGVAIPKADDQLPRTLPTPP